MKNQEIDLHSLR